MKFQENIREIEKSDDLVEKTFKIGDPSKLFEILSHKIYTDIPLAIVRELSSNAYDSHVEAGHKDLPFDVHLPTSNESYFSIRDYGTGLTPQEVEEVYTKYLESTRNKSNDYAGCFGLGSKTPFAYTDKFSVTSYRDGTARYYCLYKNDRGIPAFTKLDEEQTSEPNGLLVNVPIKSEDRVYFQEAAVKIFEFFNVRPTTNLTLYFPHRTTLYSVDKNCIVDGSHIITVILGQIPYYFNPDVIRSSIIRHCIIYLNIGDCSVSVSREELEYDQKTIDLVQDKVLELQNKVLEDYQSKLGFATNDLEKYHLARQYKGILNSIPIPSNHIKEELTINEVFEIGTRLHINRIYRFPEHIPLIIDKDIELDNKIKRNLKNFINVHNTTLLYKSTPETETVFGKPSIKLSEIPEAPRNYTNNNTIRQYVKEIDPYGCLIPVASLETENACFVSKNHNRLIFNQQEVPAPNIFLIAQALGYTKVYAISNNRIRSLKGDMPDLETAAKQYIQNWFAGRNEFERARLEFESSEELREELKDLSQECKDLYQFNNTPSASEFQKKLLIIFNIKNTDNIDYEKRFYDKYPLLRYVRLSEESLREEIKHYILSKNELRTE